MPARKQADGRWAMWLDLGRDADGDRVRRRTEGKTKREAEAKAAELRARHQRGEDITIKPRTLGELLDDWLATMESQGTKSNTVVAYRNASKNHLRPKLGTALVPRLRLKELQAVFNDFAGQLEPAYIQLIKTSLVQALTFAIEQGERTDNPARSLRIPTVRRKVGRSLSPDEVRAILAAAEGRRYGLTVRLALMGLRRGELPGLRWEDFDPKAGTLTVCRQVQRNRETKRWEPCPLKGDAPPRLLTLGPQMIAALQLYRRTQLVEQEAMEWADAGYIFLSTRTGGICPPGTIFEAFQAIATAAGIDAARLHDLRHTAATALLAGGEDIATVAEVLGHANPQITATVSAHALPHKVASASRRLEDIYSAGAEPAQQEARQRHAE